MSKVGKKTTLQSRIEDKVEQIKAIENDFPCVVIIHDIRDWTVVYMSEKGLKYLNTTMKEIDAMGVEYHRRFFNPEESADYVPGISELIQKNLNKASISHFQQVRESPNYDWKWHLSSVKIILWDDENNPILTLSVSIPIDPQHNFTAKIERLLQENNFLRKNSKVFNSLSKREKEILALMAQGLNPNDIASRLYISEATAATHRRNIRQKINAKTSYDVTHFAQAFNLI